MRLRDALTGVYILVRRMRMLAVLGSLSAELVWTRTLHPDFGAPPNATLTSRTKIKSDPAVGCIVNRGWLVTVEPIKLSSESHWQVT
jgi:hypothetical protein